MDLSSTENTTTTTPYDDYPEYIDFPLWSLYPQVVMTHYLAPNQIVGLEYEDGDVPGLV